MSSRDPGETIRAIGWKAGNERMKLKVEIKMDNAAFEARGDAPSRWRDGREAARILRDLAGRISLQTLEAGDIESLRDINGNKVGEAKVTR